MDICLACWPFPFIPSTRFDIIKGSAYLIEQPSSVWIQYSFSARQLEPNMPLAKHEGKTFLLEDELFFFASNVYEKANLRTEYVSGPS